MVYDFLREDFVESLELFEEDLSKYIATDIISRVTSLHRMIYGNRTEIESALASNL